MNNLPESFPDLSELIAPKLTKLAKFMGGLVTKLVGSHPLADYQAPLDSVFQHPPYSETALDDYWHGVLEHGEE